MRQALYRCSLYWKRHLADESPQWWRILPYLKGLIGAVVGGLLFLVALHGYQDHRGYHQLVGMWNVYAARILALPAPAPPAP